MDFELISEMLTIAKSEAEKRQVAREELSPEAGDDVYLFQDMPLLNELYLLILSFCLASGRKRLGTLGGPC